MKQCQDDSLFHIISKLKTNIERSPLPLPFFNVRKFTMYPIKNTKKKYYPTVQDNVRISFGKVNISKTYL